MKKNKTILAVLLAVLTALACLCPGALAEDEARRILTPADADAWLQTLLGEHPEDLQAAWAMTAQMKLGVAMSGGMKGVVGSLASLGELQEISPAYEGTVKGYTAFFAPCVFSVTPVDLILLTDQGAVAGLTTGPYSGKQEQETSDAFDAVDLALPVPALNGELPGTLTLPRGEGPFPAVVLVHGSGPNDRDETVVNQKPFRDLAEGLAEKGIAVYRYDKRTYVYGAEMMENHGITLVEETIEDAVVAVQLLAAQEKIDPARIYVLGHSLGGNAIPAIDRALRDAPVQARGYILMAASPRPLDVLVREQYDYQFSVAETVTPEQQAEKDAMFSELDRLRDLDTMTGDDQVLGIYAPYWQWLAAYDALAAAQEITLPCLLLQGEEDYQTTMEDFAIWQSALGEKENWRLISYPGLTHPFTPGLKTEISAAYIRPEKVDARVIEDIAAFVLQAE